jgi:hypothetical protein
MSYNLKSPMDLGVRVLDGSLLCLLLHSQLGPLPYANKLTVTGTVNFHVNRMARRLDGPGEK